MHQKSKPVLSERTMLLAAALLLALAIMSVLLPSRAFADTGEARTLIVTVVEEISAKNRLGPDPACPADERSAAACSDLCVLFQNL